MLLVLALGCFLWRKYCNVQVVVHFLVVLARERTIHDTASRERTFHDFASQSERPKFCTESAQYEVYAML